MKLNDPGRPCPVCWRPMIHYVDGWRCMNLRVPEHTSVAGQRPGSKRRTAIPRPRGIR